MPAERACFAVLPGAWPEAYLRDAGASTGVVVREATLKVAIDGGVADVARCAFLPPRVAPALRLDGAGGASEAEVEASSADLLVVVLPIGRYDDGVWSPIVERLLRRKLSGKAGASALVAWTGLEPYLAAYGAAGEDAWSDPKLADAVLAPVEAAASSLAAVLREIAAEGTSVRRGLVRFGPAAEDGILLAVA